MPKKKKNDGLLGGNLDFIRRQSRGVQALLFVALFGVIGGAGVLASSSFASSVATTTHVKKCGNVNITFKYYFSAGTTKQYKGYVVISAPYGTLDVKTSHAGKVTGPETTRYSSYTSPSYQMNGWGELSAWGGLNGDGYAMCADTQRAPL